MNDNEDRHDFTVEQLIGLRQQVRNIEQQLTMLLHVVVGVEEEPEEPAKQKPTTFGSKDG